VESVNVFGWIHGLQDALGIYLGRKWELNQNAVNVVVAVQVFDHGEHVEGRYRNWRGDESTRESDLFAGRDFTFDVELRGGIVANENGCETGANSGGHKQANFVLQLGENLVANLCTIEDACGHVLPTFAVRKEIIAHAKTLRPRSWQRSAPTPNLALWTGASFC
jgi:hypothetical protein